MICSAFLYSSIDLHNGYGFCHPKLLLEFPSESQVEYFAKAQYLSRTSGTLSLEELFPPPPIYLDILQQQIIDGRCPKFIEEVSYHMIAAKDRGKPLFQTLLIHLGMKCILQRVSVDACLKILYSIFSPELQDPMIAKKRWATHSKENQ